MHGSAKPSQQTLPGSQGASPPQEGPVTTPTDASATKRAPGRATLPGNTSKHRCGQGGRGEFLPKAAQMPPWRSGWTRRRAAGRRKSFSGIKLAPVSGLEEQAAPGRNWAGRSGEARGCRNPAAGKEGGRPAPSWPRPRLPAPPQGRSTPGAGPGHSKRPEAP